jgi:hypothetical protein
MTNNLEAGAALAMPIAYDRGCRLDVDHLARPPVWTIGHGTTQVDGVPVTSGMSCTCERADA